MRLLLCLLAAFAVLVPAPRAEACSCMGPRIEAWPKKDTVAPTNTDVFVRFPGGKKEKVILRLAGTKDTDGIPAKRVDVVSMAVRFVHIAPEIALAAGAKLEVVVGSGRQERVVSTFSVGTKADASTPKAPAIHKTTFTHEESVCCNCSSGEPFVTIQTAGKHEEAEESLYAIWTGGADGKVDWNRKPDAYVASWYGRLTLGDSSTCSVNNYPIPPSGKMVMGVRAVNQAGKQSKGKTVSVTVTPKKNSRFIVPKTSK